jgi:hypothetical protein
VGEKGQNKKVVMKINFNINATFHPSKFISMDNIVRKVPPKPNLHDFMLPLALPFLLTLQLPCVTSGVININQKVFFTSEAS